MSAKKNNELEQWSRQERPIPVCNADEDYAAYFRRLIRGWSDEAKKAEVAHQRWRKLLEHSGGVSLSFCRQRILYVLRELFDSAFLKDDYIDTGMPREDCEQAINDLNRLGYDELCQMEGADWKFAMLTRFLLKSDVDYVMVDENKAGYYINNVREEITETAAEAFFRFATFARLVHEEMEKMEEYGNVSDSLFDLCFNKMLADIKPLRKYVFPNYDENYDKLLKALLNVGKLKEKFQKVAPNKFTGGYNLKLTCNLVGLLCRLNVYDLNPWKADKLIYTDLTRYKYLNEYEANEGGLGLSPVEIKEIKSIVKRFG